MTNANKINAMQKIEMGEFMVSHPDLAKNIIPSSTQGKATAIQLWDQLSRKLNAIRPPIKDAKAWRKVFADQKYAAKKKLSFNKASKRRTGGGPYEEKWLSATEEQLVQASGLEASVDGLSAVASFGKVFDTAEEEVEYLDETIEINSEKDVSKIQWTTTKTNIKNKNVETKFDLFKENLTVCSEMQKEISVKMDSLINVNERILELKEAKFKKYVEFKERDLKLKEEKLEKIDKLLYLKERSLNLKVEEEFLNNVN